jgi:hypothetical protein
MPAAFATSVMLADEPPVCGITSSVLVDACVDTNPWVPSGLCAGLLVFHVTVLQSGVCCAPVICIMKHKTKWHLVVHEVCIMLVCMKLTGRAICKIILHITCACMQLLGLMTSLNSMLMRVYLELVVCITSNVWHAPSARVSLVAPKNHEPTRG